LGEWCKKICNYLQAGELFKDKSVDVTPQQKFALLLPFWHEMTSIIHCKQVCELAPNKLYSSGKQKDLRCVSVIGIVGIIGIWHVT
jgi:hypothetical protein